MKAKPGKQIRKDYENYYDKQSNSILYKELADQLTVENDFPLPDGFLKKWLKTTNEKSTEEKIEAEYSKFSTQLKWSLIRDKIVKSYEITAETAEILEKAKDEIRRYIPYYQTDESYLNDMAQKFIQEPQQYSKYYDDVVTDKLIVAIREKLSFKEEAVSSDDFKAILEKAVEEAKTSAPDFSVTEAAAAEEE